MVLVLNEYAGTAQQAYELMGPVVGQSTRHEWSRLVFPLMGAIDRKEALSDLDWTRALFWPRSASAAIWSARDGDSDAEPTSSGSSNCVHFKTKSAITTGTPCCETTPRIPPRPDHLRLAIPPGCLISKDTKHPYEQ